MKTLCAVFSAICLLGAALPAAAHFGMVLPSEQVVMDAANTAITLDLRFWHPFENTGMDLAKPKAFSVTRQGVRTDLLPTLTEHKEQGHTTWQSTYTLPRPGLYTFALEPQPYWEPEEDCFIVHYTKAYAAAFGDDAGWAEPLGLKAEIVPLVRPHGLYSGNLFQGRVLLDGKAVPGAEVEVEWYPGPGLAGQAPHDMMITQTVKADDNGIFSYALPRDGWWGFAALHTAKETMLRDGKPKRVELGAVLWLRAYSIRSAQKLGE